ncbi:MAG: TonB-dependent receptor [Pseudomonadota bacterium]
MFFRSTATAVAALSLAGAMAGSLAGVAQAQDAPGGDGPVTNVDRIVVTATPLEQTTDELAAPVTIVDRDEIVSSGAATLGELLKYKPGVTDSSFAPGASRPIIRGLDNFRIRIQENGIGSQDVSALSEDHAIPFDPFTAQSVEVIRGPATLRFGSEAIGGVVSVLNNRIPQFAPEGGFDGEIFGSFETADQGLDVGALLDFSVGRFAGHLDGFARDKDDYDTPDGKQPNSFVDAGGAAAGGSILFDNGFLGASVQLYETEYGLPGGEAAENEIFIDLRQVKVNAAGEITDLDGFIQTIRGQIGYADYTHDEVEGTTSEIKSTYFNEAVEGRAEIVHAPIAGFEGAVGVQVSSRDLSAGGEGGELIAPSTDNRFAAFIFEEVTVVDGAVLQLGGRIEQVNVEGFGVEVTELAPATNGGVTEIDTLGADRDLDFTPLSASAAIVVDLVEATTVGFTVQYAERAPSLLELFAKGPHEATETFEIGDPNLGKESAFSLEVTAKRVAGPFRFEAAAYRTSYKDFIFKSSTGNSCGEEFGECAVGDGEELEQIVYAANDATFIGGEIGAEWDAFTFASGGILGFDGQFDLVRATFDEGGDVPRIPPMRLGGGVFYKQGGFFSRIGVIHAFEQDDVAFNEDPTDGFTDLSAQASYAFETPDGQPGFEIGIVGSNLLDDDIRNHSSFKKADVLLPGASARVYGRIKF